MECKVIELSKHRKALVAMDEPLKELESPGLTREQLKAAEGWIVWEVATNDGTQRELIKTSVSGIFYGRRGILLTPWLKLNRATQDSILHCVEKVIESVKW